MIPVLYEKDKTTFTIDSIGFLTDCVSCTVEEERNDLYELEMVYPVGGALYDRIELDAIIKAKPNNQDNPQPFRIYKIGKAINGLVTINARHIVYDLSKVTVEPFTSTGTIEDAIQGMMDHSIPACGFVFETDKTTAGNYKVSVPSSFRALMGGVQGSLLDVFGTGEYHYDEYNIDLLLNRGSDNGVVIRYGISMIDLKQEEECDKVYTAVYPFWRSGSEYVSLDERIISVGEYPFSRIMVLDLSSDFQNNPTQAQLRTKAQQYINEHDIGIPSVSLEVSFSGTEAEQEINLCDLVTVEFEQYGVESTAKCVGITYDVLSERVKGVKLGNYKHKFIQTVTDQMKGITDDVTVPTMQIEEVIRDITDNGNGYVLLHSSDNSGKVDELLLLVGTPNLQTVQKLWRWNKNGLGYSSNGYNGTYSTAIDMSGRITAEMVKTGILRAIRIQAGNGKFVVTPDGYLTSTSGYIGSESQGLTISDHYVRNTHVMLYANGIGVMASEQTDSILGILGKAGFSKINDQWWIEPGETAYTGIGMFRFEDNAKRLGIFCYDSGTNIHNSVIAYPIRVTGSGGNVLSEKALYFKEIVYMNQHKFLTNGKFYTDTTYSLPYSDVSRKYDSQYQKNVLALYHYQVTIDKCRFSRNMHYQYTPQSGSGSGYLELGWGRYLGIFA